jgi:type IV secretory pathway VirB10-like protein
MSLINDALKRAKQAHEQQTPPQFRGAPLHTAPTPSRNSNANMTFVFIAVAVLFVAVIALGIFLYTRMHVVREQTAIASATQPAAPSTPAAEVPAPHHPAPAQPAEIPAPKPAPPAEPARAVAPPAPEPPPVVAPAPVEVPLQIFPAVRLQGLLYSPARPAAIINGRTLFIGEHVGDVRVIAIDQQSATVVWNGQTNKLTLER